MMDINEDYEQFVRDMTKGNDDKYIYLEEYELEYDYSHREIDEAHEELIYMIKEYLHEHYPNKWGVYSDWAVHVVKAEKLMGTYAEYSIVN